MLLWLAFACTNPDDADPKPDTADTGDGSPTFDAPADPVDCAPGRDAPLLDAALADAGLAREDLGWTDREWNNRGDLVDPTFQLSWFTAAHHSPEHAACTARQLEADLDHAAASAAPVTNALGALAGWADAPTTGGPLVAPEGVGFAEALAELADATGASGAEEAAAELDPALAEALTPVILAIAEGVRVRAAIDAVIDPHDSRMPKKIYDRTPGWVIAVNNVLPDITDPDELAWWAEWYLGADGPRALVLPARRIAAAVEAVDWTAFAGGDVDWSFETPMGVVKVSPSTNDSFDEDLVALLHVDLGGADLYLGSAGATASEDNPVSVLLDLGGNDLYGYPPGYDVHDGSALPSDAAGRQNGGGGYWPSASQVSRQGVGRHGIGLLFDLGASSDSYASLRMSQGFGAAGVGVLRDDGGRDSYTAEAGAQGSAVWGLGLLLDGGGDDQYTIWAFGQGFGYVASGGALVDVGDGKDRYRSDPGNDYGGTTVYHSAQLADGQGNSSFTQGAGFGMRADTYSTWLAGGLGVLRDGGGDDTYVAGVFAQGTGYWEGTGILADAGGDDTYDALWYVQGGAAHMALGMLLDAAGNDSYNLDFQPYNVHLGSGHDFSLGVFVDDAGDDRYRFTTLAVGASNCQGVGVFVDNDGADTYEALSTYAVGLGNHSTECDGAQQNTADSEGLFMDAGGDADAWTWPDPTDREPGDDRSFGHAWAGTSDEKGGAVDGDGETNFRAR